MNVANLIKQLELIVKLIPEAAKYEVIVEERRTWRSYHLYSGFSRRAQHGKKDQLVWRHPK